MGKWTKRGDSYRPSNGTEGCAFQEHFCDRCINEKFSHTQKHGDKQCDILNRSLLWDKNDEGYPKEWQYGDNDDPLCTAWVKWDWGRGDDDNGLNEPPVPEPVDPAQLVIPFELMEIERNSLQPAKTLQLI